VCECDTPYEPRELLSSSYTSSTRLPPLSRITLIALYISLCFLFFSVSPPNPHLSLLCICSEGGRKNNIYLCTIRVRGEFQITRRKEQLLSFLHVGYHVKPHTYQIADRIHFCFERLRFTSETPDGYPDICQKVGLIPHPEKKKNTRKGGKLWAAVHFPSPLPKLERATSNFPQYRAKISSSSYLPLKSLCCVTQLDMTST